jgi:hypothetical protein
MTSPRHAAQPPPLPERRGDASILMLGIFCAAHPFAGSDAARTDDWTSVVVPRGVNRRVATPRGAQPPAPAISRGLGAPRRGLVSASLSSSLVLSSLPLPCSNAPRRWRGPLFFFLVASPPSPLPCLRHMLVGGDDGRRYGRAIFDGEWRSSPRGAIFGNGGGRRHLARLGNHRS